MEMVLKYLLMRLTKTVEGDPAACCMSCFGGYREESRPGLQLAAPVVGVGSLCLRYFRSAQEACSCSLSEPSAVGAVRS